MNHDEPTAQQAAQILANLPEQAQNADLTDWDGKGQAYLADALKRDRIDRFNFDAQRGYPESDWEHPGLAPYAHAIASVRAWNYGQRGILASGKTGRGKTRAIFALYRRLACEEGIHVRYFFAGDWFFRLQSQIHFGQDEARGWIESLASVPVVILDDLGQQAVTTARTEWAEAWFFRFLDLRIAKKLPLIVSTNLSATEIAAGTNARHGSTIRQEPLLRRLLELTEVVKFEVKEKGEA